MIKRIQSMLYIEPEEIIGWDIVNKEIRDECSFKHLFIYNYCPKEIKMYYNKLWC